MALATAAIAAASLLLLSPGTVLAQGKKPGLGKGEQFFPVLVYRTGPYAPNGAPWANGFVDYLKLVNVEAASTA